MPSPPASRLRRLVAALFALTLLVPVATACGDDDQGAPLERDTSENPNGGGQPADGSTTERTTDDTTRTSVDAGQPQSGTDDTGENEPSSGDAGG